jgi:hypothetical protein
VVFQVVVSLFDPGLHNGNQIKQSSTNLLPD